MEQEHELEVNLRKVEN